MTRRTLYATFTEAEYEHHAGRFWKVPNALGDLGNAVSLSKCFEIGRYGVTAMLPALGLLANLTGDRGEGFAWSAQHIARLTGSAPGTIERAKAAITKLGLARPTLTRRYGKRLTGWADINPALAVPPDRTKGPRHPYFYFSADLLTGGQWAYLSHAEQLVYLALATRYRKATQLPHDIDWVKRGSYPDAVLKDLMNCYADSAFPGTIRFAHTSFGDLEEATGLGRTTIQEAVARLKPPRAWDMNVRDEEAEHLPVWALPAADPGESLVYVFRDHVRHLPWSLIEARRTHAPFAARSRASKSSCVPGLRPFA